MALPVVREVFSTESDLGRLQGLSTMALDGVSLGRCALTTQPEELGDPREHGLRRCTTPLSWDEAHSLPEHQTRGATQPSWACREMLSSASSCGFHIQKKERKSDFASHSCGISKRKDRCQRPRQEGALLPSSRHALSLGLSTNSMINPRSILRRRVFKLATFHHSDQRPRGPRIVGRLQVNSGAGQASAQYGH